MIKAEELSGLRHAEMFQGLGVRLLRKHEHDIAGKRAEFLWQRRKFRARHALHIIE